MSDRVKDRGLDTIPVSSQAPLRARVAKRRVLLVYHRNGIATVPLLPGAEVVVGREPPADVALADASLSRRHARFLPSASEVVVEDLGSTNGTRIRGERVERAVVKPGDEVMLGAATASIHELTDSAGSPLGFDGHDAFRAAVENEIARARFFGRALALIMVRGARPEDGGVLRACARVREIARPVDRVAVYGPDAIEVLAVEASVDQAHEIATAIAGRGGGEPLGLCGVATFPGAAASADALIEASRDAARSATLAEPVRVASLDATHTFGPEPRGTDDGRLVRASPAMARVAETAIRLARSAIPVLLHGETGTGKEVLARLIHESGPRGGRSMVSVNCGALPTQLLESTLFGHERGAFTGASQQQKGVFEAADGGTVFLDEVGELPAPAQAALLRVLETKRVTRVGSTKEIEVDVRVVAATHRDLEVMCEAGGFRQDLYYRLNTMTLVIPPLRVRREDIRPLVLRFLREAEQAGETHARRVAPEALALLESYAWPGNVRELRNAVLRAAVIAEGDAIELCDLPERVRAAAAPPGSAPLRMATLAPVQTTATVLPPIREELGRARSLPEGLKARMERLEVEAIIEALREADGSQAHAAKRLDLPLRTLQHKIKTLGIRRLGYGAPPSGKG